MFAAAPFIQHLGATLTDCGPGWCETALESPASQRQQNGFVHGGVLATLADHTAGGCASTHITPDEMVLTIEFKVNFLRPATSPRIRCRADTVRAGRTISVVESSVFSVDGETAALVAKATVTLAVVHRAPHEKQRDS